MHFALTTIKGTFEVMQAHIRNSVEKIERVLNKKRERRDADES
jgi:hypothetical protein